MVRGVGMGVQDAESQELTLNGIQDWVTQTGSVPMRKPFTSGKRNTVTGRFITQSIIVQCTHS